MSNINKPIIVNEKPPVWDMVCSAFKIVPKDVVFTYGDKIYNPDTIDIPDNVLEHEKIHMKQHSHNDVDAALWWGKFLRDPKFRVDQEAQAYAIQYLYITQFVKDRNKRIKVLWDLSRMLCGPMYNNATDFQKAQRAIKFYARI